MVASSWKILNCMGGESLHGRYQLLIILQPSPMHPCFLSCVFFGKYAWMEFLSHEAKLQSTKNALDPTPCTCAWLPPILHPANLLVDYPHRACCWLPSLIINTAFWIFAPRHIVWIYVDIKFCAFRWGARAPDLSHQVFQIWATKFPRGPTRFVQPPHRN